MCSEAKRRHEDATTWKNRWAWLMFILGIAMACFLVGALVLILNDSLSKGIISGLGSLLSGGGFAWVLNRYKEKTEEEKEAFSDLTKERNRINDIRLKDQERENKTKRGQEARNAFLGNKNTMTNSGEKNE